MSRTAFNGKILLLTFVFSLAIYPIVCPQGTESNATTHWAFNSILIPDFTLGATDPSTVPADAATSATSTIVVSPINGFNGTVTLSDFPLPVDLSCTAIDPATIPKGSGMATVSCSSSFARTYNVAIIGTSGEVRRNATITFRFAASTSPDFTIAAIGPVSLTSGSTATSSVTVIPLGGFDSQVNLTVTVFPSTGFSVSLNPQSFVYGSGTSTATFSSSSPGDYNVTITGTSRSLSHTTSVVVAVTLVVVPDFGISASSGSINIQAGNPGTTKISITPSNGFTGSVTMVVSAPAGVSCSLSSTSVQSSGESILTCNGRTAGDYTVRIRATGGPSPHTTTVYVHVDAVSPTAPGPSTTLGLSHAVFYGIIGVIIIVVVAGTVLVLRRSRRFES